MERFEVYVGDRTKRSYPGRDNGKEDTGTNLQFGLANTRKNLGEKRVFAFYPVSMI